MLESPAGFRGSGSPQIEAFPSKPDGIVPERTDLERPGWIQVVPIHSTIAKLVLYSTVRVHGER